MGTKRWGRGWWLLVALALPGLTPWGSGAAWAADLTVTAANVALNASTATTAKVQFGEAVTQGQPVYRKAADNKYYKADNDDTAAKAVIAGVAITKGAANGYGYIVTAGPTDLGATLTVGEIYVVSSTLGGICPASDLNTGDYVTIVGVATTTSSCDLWFHVSTAQKP